MATSCRSCTPDLLVLSCLLHERLPKCLMLDDKSLMPERNRRFHAGFARLRSASARGGGFTWWGGMIQLGLPGLARAWQQPGGDEGDGTGQDEEGKGQYIGFLARVAAAVLGGVADQGGRHQ